MSPPPSEERSPKRQKGSSSAMAENTIDIDPNGDVLLAVTSMAGLKDVKLQVSGHVLAMTSPVFKQLLADARPTPDPHQLLSLPNDDGETVHLLVNILHLRNDKLPSRLQVEALCGLAKLAEKYRCATAVGRSCMGWFDRLHSAAKSGNVVDSWKLVQAAHALDEPVYFTRFTEKMVLEEPIAGSKLVEGAKGEQGVMRQLTGSIHNRQLAQLAAVRADLDILIEPCSSAFSKSSRHYTDYAPGMRPDEDENGLIVGSICRVDEQAATQFMGALRDETIWPPTVWPSSLGAITEKIQKFEVPYYDDVDKCDFCEDTNGRFRTAVEVVKKMHRGRLWGLCLDCFKAGGVSAADCRYEHSKPKA